MGDFRAPRSNRVPGDVGGWQYLCLEHVRAFNAGYNYFDGLSPDEIHEAQSPLAGWVRDQVGKGGREAFTIGDPHGLFTTAQKAPAAPRRWPAKADVEALSVLGLTDAATGADVRRAWRRLARRYHPDSNGGDRSAEGKLQAVVKAYTHLKAQPAFRSE